MIFRLKMEVPKKEIKKDQNSKRIFLLSVFHPYTVLRRKEIRLKIIGLLSSCFCLQERIGRKIPYIVVNFYRISLEWVLINVNGILNDQKRVIIK